MLIIKQKEKSDLIFPQANDVYKVLKYVDNLCYNYHKENFDTINDKVVERQKQYYHSAAIYLGLIEYNKANKLAKFIFSMDKKSLLVAIVNLILSKDIFYRYYFNRDIDDTINNISRIYSMSISTATRRASTVKSWVEWCDIIIRDNHVNIEVI